MNSVDSLDKKDMIFKYGKYILLILLVIIVIILLFVRGDKKGYDSIENKMMDAAKKYVQNNNIVLANNASKFIELPDLGEFDGTGLCSRASGVIVTNRNGSFVYEPYLKCDDYSSDIRNQNNKYITLVGDTVVLLNKGEVYEEKYYTLSKEATVVISGTVGKVPGIYNIYYYVYADGKLKETAYRTIIVVENNKNKNITDLKDRVNPVITLKGQTEVVLGIGEHYEEEGYTAYDYEDGTLNRKVMYNPNPETIDTSKTGTYTIIYSVTNSKGNSVSATRKITVVRHKGNITINLTKENNDISKSVVIHASIVGSGYEQTIQPLTTRLTNFTYEVKGNGTYTFVVEDIYGNLIKKTIEIDSIDDIAPSGNCIAKIKGNNTTITVKASDNTGIAGYSYIIDGKTTSFVNDNTYDVSSVVKEVYVKIKDIVGNTKTIKCDVTVVKDGSGSGGGDKDDGGDQDQDDNVQGKMDADGIKVIIPEGSKPRIQTPITTFLASKGYTVADLNKCIYDRVKAAGPGTRAGVVAAAYGLIDCTITMTGYVISYDHVGGKVDGSNCQLNSSICGKLGVNTKWGGSGWCDATRKCYSGLNCATFIRWAMCNGGMDLCSKGSAAAFSMTNSQYFPGADGVVISGSSVSYYSGNNLTKYDAATLVRMLKPGDIIARKRLDDTTGSSHHTFIVIGKDDNGIYAAHDGYFTNKIAYSTLLDRNYYYRILFLDNYYSNKNNRNNLYK